MYFSRPFLRRLTKRKTVKFTWEKLSHTWGMSLLQIISTTFITFILECQCRRVSKQGSNLRNQKRSYLSHPSWETYDEQLARSPLEGFLRKQKRRLECEHDILIDQISTLNAVKCYSVIMFKNICNKQDFLIRAMNEEIDTNLKVRRERFLRKSIRNVNLDQPYLINFRWSLRKIYLLNLFLLCTNQIPIGKVSTIQDYIGLAFKANV